MSKVNVRPQMRDTEPQMSAEVHYAATRSAAPDPVMLDKIGKGLHELYDGVPQSTLPIYFGPVLGELYLTPLPRRRAS
ncbi:MAG: hypothetical protein JOZ16_18665 [Methylobacteriaceae bacterium]|nr:hypothetical protein [Methylobacteriaceae bacterium]